MNDKKPMTFDDWIVLAFAGVTISMLLAYLAVG